MKDNNNLLRQRIITSALITIALLLNTKPSSAQELEVDIHSLCSKFPLNSRCEDYETPISLKSRSGDEGICSVMVTEKPSACKFVVTEDKITVYREFGRSLEILKEEKATKEYNLSLTNITKINYREFKKRDMGKFLGSSLAIGILPSLLFVKKDRYSELEIVHNDETLTLVLDRDRGLYLRSRLERATGIFADFSEEESSDTEEANEVSDEQGLTYPRDLAKFCESYPYNSRCKNDEE